MTDQKYIKKDFKLKEDHNTGDILPTHEKPDFTPEHEKIIGARHATADYDKVTMGDDLIDEFGPTYGGIYHMPNLKYK
jgi:hypothetical protein